MPERGIPQRIAARRAARRRRLRRQRLLATGGALAMVAVTVAIADAGFFSGSDPLGPGGDAATKTKTSSTAATGNGGGLDEAGGGSGEAGGGSGEAGGGSGEAGGGSGEAGGGSGEAGGGPSGAAGAPSDWTGGGAATLRNTAPQPDWRPHTGPVPILMYHVIDEPAPDAPYPDLYLSADDFRSQIRWLAEQGYEAVTLRQVERAWWREGRLPEKPIVLSFDDGYVSHYEVAFPAMRELGWPGLLNLKAGETDIYKRQVREMLAAGWELGSHTINHPDLTTLDATALADELTRSRQILRRRFGVPVTHLCYPAGRYDDAVVAAAEAAGYATASTTDPGLAASDDPFRLKRIRINRGDGPAALAAAGL